MIASNVKRHSLPNTGVWTTSGTSAFHDLANGVRVNVSKSGSENFTSNTLTGNGYTPAALSGGPALRSRYFDGDIITITFTDLLGTPVFVNNPILHTNSIGFLFGGIGNSAIVTLLGGLTWIELSSTQATVTPTTIVDATLGSPLANATLEIQGTISGFQMTTPFVNPAPSDDVIRFAFSIRDMCVDTDMDNIPDIFDLDSDSDGCPDVIEANHTDVDSDSLLGVSPITVNSEGLVQGQGGYTGTTAAVTDILSQGPLCSVYLPVELLSYSAEYEKDSRAVHLTWSTASEIDNDYFEIHRSQDLLNWELISTVDGAGSSQEILTYTAKDNNPLFGQAYYRLQQTDLNGKINFGGLHAVNCDDINHSWYIVPNAVSEDLVIYNLPQSFKSVQLIDFAGTSIKTNFFGGGDKLFMIASHLSSGIYFLIIDGRSERFVKL